MGRVPHFFNVEGRRKFQMVKISDAIQVKVSQNDGEQGKRIISVTIMADKARFLLPELLAEEGAVAPLDKRLKQACLAEVVEFLTSGRKLLGGLKRGRASRENNESKDLAPKAASLMGKGSERAATETLSLAGKAE